MAYKVVMWNMDVFVIVNYIVLVFTDDVHRTKHIERVVNAPLYIFEVNLFSNLKYVKSKNLTSQNFLYI